MPWFQTTGHLTISWERLLREGLVGIAARARRHLDSLDDDDPARESRADFLLGAILCCEAIGEFAQRYAREASTLAESTEVSPQRARELLDTADSLILGEAGHVIGVIGMEHVVVVHTRDATLVCPKDRAEEVKKILTLSPHA